MPTDERTILWRCITFGDTPPPRATTSRWPDTCDLCLQNKSSFRATTTAGKNVFAANEAQSKKKVELCFAIKFRLIISCTQVR